MLGFVPGAGGMKRGLHIIMDTQTQTQHFGFGLIQYSHRVDFALDESALTFKHTESNVRT